MSRNTTAGNEIEHVIAKVFKKLTASLDPYNTNKIRNTYIFKSFEDIAIEAILYAMKNSKINWSDLASAEEHLFYSARKVSSWVISKELLKVKNSIVRLSSFVLLIMSSLPMMVHFFPLFVKLSILSPIILF